MHRPPRIDWALIVNELLRAGVSLPKIAAALEVSKAAPYRWLVGAEPRYSSAVLLLSLHRQFCKSHQGEHEAAEHPARTAPENPTGEDDGTESGSESGGERRRAVSGCR